MRLLLRREGKGDVFRVRSLPASGLLLARSPTGALEGHAQTRMHCRPVRAAVGIYRTVHTTSVGAHTHIHIPYNVCIIYIYILISTVNKKK